MPLSEEPTAIEGLYTRAAIAPGAGVPVRRRGAYCGHGVGIFTWACPAEEFSFEFTIANFRSPGIVMGAWVGSAPNVGIYNDGGSPSIRLYFGGSIIATLLDTVAENGPPSKYRIDWTRTGATVYRDGVVVGTPTWSEVVWNTATVAQYSVCGRFSGEYVGAVLYDVSFIDPNSDANTAYFPLDARDSSGNYPNQHPGSTVGDATITGTVLPVIVNAPGGDGVPVSPAPVVICSRADTEQSSTAQSNTVVLVASVDPYGWAVGSRFDVAPAHSAVVHVTGRMRCTLLAAPNDIEMRLALDDGGTTYPDRKAFTIDTVNKWIPFALSAVTSDVNAAASYRLIWADNAVGDTIRFDDVYLTAIITPSATTT